MIDPVTTTYNMFRAVEKERVFLNDINYYIPKDIFVHNLNERQSRLYLRKGTKWVH